MAFVWELTRETIDLPLACLQGGFASTPAGSASAMRPMAVLPERTHPCRLWRDWYFTAEQPAPAPHLAHPEGCAALRIVLVTVPRVSRSCEHFPDGFDLHLLLQVADGIWLGSTERLPDTAELEKEGVVATLAVGEGVEAIDEGR